jgi:hypothetical protein
MRRWRFVHRRTFPSLQSTRSPGRPHCALSPAQLAEQLPELVGGQPDPAKDPGERADGQLVV